MKTYRIRVYFTDKTETTKSGVEREDVLTLLDGLNAYTGEEDYFITIKGFSARVSLIREVMYEVEEEEIC